MKKLLLSFLFILLAFQSLAYAGKNNPLQRFVEKKSVKLMMNYFSNLRECHPGVYRYLRNGTYVTSTIVGLENDNCIVTSVGQKIGDYSLKSTKKSSEVRCSYERVNLAIFTDQAAESLVVKDKMNGEAYNAVQEMQVRYCKAV